MCLAFHSVDLWPQDLWMHVQEQALSHHVAGLATLEAGVQHSRGTGMIQHHGITRMGGMQHGGRSRGVGQWLGQERAWGGGKAVWLGEWVVGSRQGGAHRILLWNDTIKAALLGTQPLSKCLPFHIGLWHQQDPIDPTNLLLRFNSSQ